MQSQDQTEYIRRRIQGKNLKPPRRPQKEVADEYIDILEDSVRSGNFSLAAILQLEEPWRQIALMWIIGEGGYDGVALRVELKNVGKKDLVVTVGKKERRVFRQATNDKQPHIFRKTATVKPGKTLTLTGEWAVHALWKHGLSTFDEIEAYENPEAVNSQCALQEVRGSLLVDGESFDYPVDAEVSDA